MTPYQSHIDEDDHATSQALKQAGRGLRYNDPEMSIFSSGQNAMALLPEMMQVGQMMEMRGRMNAQDRGIRGEIAADREKQNESGVFDSFVNELDGLAGIHEPAQRTQYVADMQQRNPQFLAHEGVQKAIKNLLDADQAVTTASTSALTRRRNESGGRDLDFAEKQRETLEEAATIEGKTYLEKAKAGAASFSAMKNDSTFTAAKRLGEAIGRSQDLPVEIGKGLVGLMSRFGEGEEADSYNNAISEVVAAHGMSSNIKRSFASEGRVHQPYFERAKLEGINLGAVFADDQGPPEEREGLIDVARDKMIRARRLELLSKHSTEDVNGMMPREEERIESALMLGGRIYAAETEFKALEGQLAALPKELDELAMKAQQGDGAAKSELNRKMSVLSYLAFKARSNVNKNLEQADQERTSQVEAIQVQTSIEKLASIVAARERADAYLDIAQVELELKQDYRQFQEFESFMKRSANTRMWNKIKDTEEYAAMRERLREHHNAQSSRGPGPDRISFDD